MGPSASGRPVAVSRSASRSTPGRAPGSAGGVCASARVSLRAGVGVGMLLGVLLGIGGSRVAMLVRVVIIGLAGGRASWAGLRSSGLVGV